MVKGDKVKFKEEKQRYTVRAVGKRYAILTKPFNPRRTVLYTIIDFKQQIRGPENLIFCAGAETDENCSEMLKRLETGETGITSRNRIKVNIEEKIKLTNELNKVIDIINEKDKVDHES